MWRARKEAAAHSGESDHPVRSFRSLCVGGREAADVRGFNSPSDDHLLVMGPLLAVLFLRLGQKLLGAGGPLLHRPQPLVGRLQLGGVLGR